VPAVDARLALLERANNIRLDRWIGARSRGVVYPQPRLYTLRHLDQAVAVVRQNAAPADRALLEALGHGGVTRRRRVT
jgi:hypothetical protein